MPKPRPRQSNRIKQRIANRKMTRRSPPPKPPRTMPNLEQSDDNADYFSLNPLKTGKANILPSPNRRSRSRSRGETLPRGNNIINPLHTKYTVYNRRH